MAKIAIKSEKPTPFGGIFTIMDRFESVISPVVDSTLGLDVRSFGLKVTSRIKAFVFRFISVAAKWIRTSRQDVLNIYTRNAAYASPFLPESG